MVLQGSGLVILEAPIARAKGTSLRRSRRFQRGQQRRQLVVARPKGRWLIWPCKRPSSTPGSSIEQIDLVAPSPQRRRHDAAEMTAWNEVFGSRLDQVPAPPREAL
jgi:hypothetical protein